MASNALRAAALGLATTMAGLTQADAQTVRFANTDVEGLEELQRQFGEFEATLEDITGFKIEFFPVSGRTVAAEALRAERVDFVLTGPSEYVVMSSQTEAEPVVAFSRVDYFSVVAVMADSGIGEPADLEGERVAFNDVGSTSGHLGPSIVLADKGLDPVGDIDPFHTSPEVGFRSLIRGDVAALATSNASYMRLRDNSSEPAPGAFKVIARGPDLPNDVLMAGGHVDEAVVERMREAFANEESAGRIHEALISTVDGQDKYQLTAFLTNITDADYDYMREAYRAIGQDQFASNVSEQ